MHEASLVQSLLALVDHGLSSWNGAHPESRAGRITGLHLRLGLLSCVEEETFRSCFELMAEGTVAQGARLDIRREPLPCTCRDCQASFTLTERRFVCPSCQGRNLDCAGGHELTLLDIEAAPEGADARARDRKSRPQEGPQEGPQEE